MITATCATESCNWHAVGRFVLGSPDPVKCGACGNDCALTDPQPDPPQPDDA